MLAYIKKQGIKLLSYESCAHRFTLSACMGIYIAFSPFLGLHTAMVFLFSWLFALNCAIVLAVSVLVNNPWTMIPVYGTGYVFGDWVVSFFGITKNHNPSWMQTCNSWIYGHTGLSGISLWGFLIGGNILGIGLGMLAYPVIKKYAALFLGKGKARAQLTFVAARKAVDKAKRKMRNPFTLRVPQGEREYELNFIFRKSLDNSINTFYINNSSLFLFPFALRHAKGREK